MSRRNDQPAKHGCGAMAVLWLLPALLVLPVAGQSSNGSDAQKTPPPEAKKPAKPASHSAAQENPFPADVSAHAAQQQGSTRPPDAPDAPAMKDAPAASDAPATKDQQPAAPGQKPGDAAKENPFPEDQSRSAAAAAAAPAGESSSSSSSSSSAAGDAGAPDPNADVPREGARHRLRKPAASDIESGSLAGEGRAADDVRVAKFYYNDGNYPGAYARFSEAARLDPSNLDAIYGLATTADKLRRKDEALANYKLYLDAAPDGKDAKSARRALELLQK